MLIGSLLVLSSCATSKIIEVPKTEYVFYVPEKVTRPQKPKFEMYDSRYGLNERNNFRKFQINSSLTKNYINSLVEIIEYYENQIDSINKQKALLENKNKK